MEINKNEETVAKSSESIFCRGCLAFLLKVETLSFRCFAQARSQKINGKQRVLITITCDIPNKSGTPKRFCFFSTKQSFRRTVV